MATNKINSEIRKYVIHMAAINKQITSLSDIKDNLILEGVCKAPSAGKEIDLMKSNGELVFAEGRWQLGSTAWINCNPFERVDNDNVMDMFRNIHSEYQLHETRLYKNTVILHFYMGMSQHAYLWISQIAGYGVVSTMHDGLSKIWIMFHNESAARKFWEEEC